MALDILAGSVPAQQRLDGKAVAQVMQPRAWSTRGGVHLRLVEQLIEGPMDVSRVECRPPTRDEELRRRQPFGEAIAVRAVFRECRPGRVSNRSQPRFAELRLPNGQQALAASVVRVGQATQPVINLLRDALLDSFIVHGDETEVQVLKEPGRKAQAKSYMWVQMTQASGADSTGPPIRLFGYSPSRSTHSARTL